MIQHTIIVDGRERSCVPHRAGKPCKWAKARLEASSTLQDWGAKQRGSSPYRYKKGGKPTLDVTSIGILLGLWTVAIYLALFWRH